MPNCIDSIVTLGICPDDGVSTSGFTLMTAAGMSSKNFDNIASENYIQGTKMAMAKKGDAIRKVRNDFIGILQASKIVTQMSVRRISTGNFNAGMSMPSSTAERGITLHKASYRGTLRGTFIDEVQILPLTNGSGTLKIYDGDNVTSWPVTLTAGQVNVFDKTNLGGFPYKLPDNSNVRVLLSAPGVTFAKSTLTCLAGCNGSMPNECGWVDGWDGTAAVKSDGFGMNLTFYCQCDYDQILCDMANSFIGEMIWLQWQMQIFEEQILSNRFNSWVVYSADTLRQETLPNLLSLYNDKKQQMSDGLINILNSYRDPCLNCRGIRKVVNV